MKTVIVGTRQSPLAMTQTRSVVEQLKRFSVQWGIDVQFEVRPFVTKGDQILDVTLSKIGGKGLFVSEIEQALLLGEIDIAVHSMKDMPSELPDGLMIGAVPTREDARDCIITRSGCSLGELPIGSRVGTSSLRRASQLLHYRADLEVTPIRGNIDSRLRKLESGGLDAIVLAAAGLHRLGWHDRITSYIPLDMCVPAVGQGALCIECRSGDVATLELLSPLQHEPTALAVAAERSFLGRLQGGCQVPIGAYATIVEHLDASHASSFKISLTGIVASLDGITLLKEHIVGEEPKQLGIQVAQSLIARGADRILSAIGE